MLLQAVPLLESLGWLGGEVALACPGWGVKLRRRVGSLGPGSVPLSAVLIAKAKDRRLRRRRL